MRVATGLLYFEGVGVEWVHHTELGSENKIVI